MGNFEDCFGDLDEADQRKIRKTLIAKTRVINGMGHVGLR
jgi:hypothetical protein